MIRKIKTLSTLILEGIKNESRHLRVKPLNALGFLTFRCTSRCKTCNIWRREKIQELSKDQWLEVLGKLNQARINAFEIFGGDALLRKDAILRGDLEQADHVGDWRAFLLDEDEEGVRLLRERTRTGRPCGPAEFVAKLEALLSRRLTPHKRGRKPKRIKGTEH